MLKLMLMRMRMLIISSKCLAADNNASYHRLVLQEQEAKSKLNANR
jgi:hypothetical protein